MKTSRKNSKQRSRQLKKHAKRLAAYSAAAAATVLTTGDQEANAIHDEVVWNIPDVTVTDQGYPSPGIAFNMVNGTTYKNIRMLLGPDPDGTAKEELLNNYGNFEKYYWPSRGRFRLTASYGGYIYMPSYTPDPEGTFPPGPDPNAPVSLLYERPAGTWDPTIPGPDKQKAIGVPIGAMNLASSRWNIGFMGAGDDNALPYYVGDPIGSNGQNFGMEGAWRGFSYYALVDFPLGHKGVIGIHFKLPTPDPNDAITNRESYFGWAEVTKFRIGGGDFQFILHGFGYQRHQGTATIPVTTSEFLTLEVHADGAPFPGKVFIRNTSIGDVIFDYYEIHSPSGGGNETLNPAGWVSLEDQDYEGSSIADIVADGKNDGFDFLEWQRSSQDPTIGAAIQDQYGLVPPNTGWQEVGGISDIVVAEGRVQGTTTLASGESIDLGLLYDTTQDTLPGNGFFKYLTPGGLIQEGEIVRIDTGGAIAASAAVPEPNSIMLLAAGAAGLGMWRKRRAG